MSSDIAILRRQFGGEARVSDLRRLVRTIPDYPKPGILFRDVTTLFGDAKGFKAMRPLNLCAHFRGSPEAALRQHPPTCRRAGGLGNNAKLGKKHRTTALIRCKCLCGSLQILV